MVVPPNRLNALACKAHCCQCLLSGREGRDPRERTGRTRTRSSLADVMEHIAHCCYPRQGLPLHSRHSIRTQQAALLPYPQATDPGIHRSGPADGRVRLLPSPSWRLRMARSLPPSGGSRPACTLARTPSARRFLFLSALLHLHFLGLLEPRPLHEHPGRARNPTVCARGFSNPFSTVTISKSLRAAGPACSLPPMAIGQTRRELARRQSRSDRRLMVSAPPAAPPRLSRHSSWPQLIPDRPLPDGGTLLLGRHNLALRAHEPPSSALARHRHPVP